MTRRPKHARVDGNQAEIISDLRDMGAYVWITAALGGEVLDAIAFWRGRAVPIEFKVPDAIDNLTDGEIEGIRRLRGVGVTAVVATCTEDVVSAFVELMVADDSPFPNFGEWRRGKTLEYDYPVGEMGAPLLGEEENA